jgi:hypothetical protein
VASGTRSSAFFEQKVAEILRQLAGHPSKEVRQLEDDVRRLEAIFAAWTPETSFDERRRAVQQLFELQRMAQSLLPPRVRR